jgi:hypothetical protein
VNTYQGTHNVWQTRRAADYAASVLDDLGEKPSADQAEDHEGHVFTGRL